MKGFLIALQFLTRLPGPQLHVTGEAFAGSMRWFPAAGLVVGAIVAGGAWGGARIDPWVGALVALVTWVGVTGALHLDGLGDIADAAGAAHKGIDRDRLLAVLADPHVGSFGVVAIGLQLLAKLILLHAVVDARAFLPLALVPAAARIGPLVWMRMLPDLHSGLASHFRGAVTAGTLAIWFVVAAAMLTVAPGLIALAVLVPAWAAWLRARIGGISGDGHGAGIELVETGLLVAILIARWIA